MNTDIVSYYKDRAKEYEKIYSKPERQEDLKSATTILQEIFADKQVLEIACGPGNITKYISRLRPDFQITAIDLSPNMIELAKANNIRVVISSVLPAYDFPWRPGMKPAEKVVSLNAMLKDYANKKGIVYLDYFSAMVDERKGLPKSLSEDGVHPNLAGYKIMEPLAAKAIAEALKRK